MSRRAANSARRDIDASINDSRLHKCLVAADGLGVFPEGASDALGFFVMNSKNGMVFFVRSPISPVLSRLPADQNDFAVDLQMLKRRNLGDCVLDISFFIQSGITTEIS